MCYCVICETCVDEDEMTEPEYELCDRHLAEMQRELDCDVEEDLPPRSVTRLYHRAVDTRLRRQT